MILNLATILTISRIAFIPIIVFFYIYNNGELRNIAAFIFLLALITDYFDGLVARKLNQETTFGAFLDPIADKLLVVITILLLSRSFDSMIFLIPALIIISREFLVIAIRQRLAEIKVTMPMRVNTLGKIKTTFQMLSLFILIHPNILFSFINLHIIGLLLLFIAAVLTVISFIYYVRNSWDDILR
ncbi:CDP-diacylglycerol--glycerol-3-phosphate 3-phosphatidyltransferase [Gammaproteobacteria bacterium]|nr:CDP-diacylglycerol--glycerol-3-phosphate 3-phosphatidyltransferase [Gammaproteobacteria bacterium]